LGEEDQYYVSNHHEPIISVEVFEKAQQIMKMRVFPPTLFVSFLLKFPDRFKKEFKTY
jgi:hypothetical protein